LCLLRAPAREQREDDVLTAHPGLQPTFEDDAPLSGHREVHVTGRPTEAQRGGADAVAERAVRAVRAAVRVRARNERAGDDEALLREVEVEDAVARGRVVRTRDAVEFG